MNPNDVKAMIEGAGGTVNEAMVIPDGDGFHGVMTASFPLPKTHWIYEKGEDGFSAPPPMPFRVGVRQSLSVTLTREQFAECIRAAGRYAVRAATMHGAEMDFDPDAMLQNFCVGFLGYWTADGLSGDDWANPKAPF